MDKILKKYLFISLIFIINFSCATTMSIDEQIEAIKKAPESERVGLMNQFKRQLILMNQKQRENAIYQLKNSKTEESIKSHSNNFINGIQSSSIEQNLQINQNIVREEQIREYTRVPTTPTIEQPPRPVTPNPTIVHPEQQIPTISNPTVIEPQQQIPTVSTPTVVQPQQIPTTSTVHNHSNKYLLFQLQL
jgi:hypothetical protein